MGPIISVFVMVLVVSILAGLTFLFVSGLKTNVADTTATTSAEVLNEVGWINATDYVLDGASALGARSFAITTALNWTDEDGGEILEGNWTLSSLGVIVSTGEDYPDVLFNYTYNYIGDPTAYNAVDSTEGAGATVVGYLPLIFLAVIFGAILTLVLRIILPYINLGQQMGGF